MTAWYLVQTMLTERQYSDWHWLETDLKSIQHGSDWCHVDWVRCVESMLSLAVRCLRSAVPARPPGAAVSAGDVRLGIHSAVVSTLVSDGVSQRVTGRGAASSDILSDLCSLRWLTHRPRASLESFIWTVVIRPSSQTHWDMTSNDPQCPETVHGWRWAAESRLCRKSLII